MSKQEFKSQLIQLGYVLFGKDLERAFLAYKKVKKSNVR